MKLTFIGTGYVGLVSGVCFSEIGNQVTCVDKDLAKIERLKKGDVPIYEPGLKELIEKNTSLGNLSFTSDLTSSVQNADIVFICVGTPSLPSGEANLEYVEQVAQDIALAMDGYKIVVTKSTVPVGTNDKIKKIIGQLTPHPFDIVSIPEFLREGSAVKDTLNPDRIIIGTASERAAAALTELHKPLTDEIMVTEVRSAEMIKYASNAFLATKISFINEIANICEKVGADVTHVAKGMGYDNRIGSSFLQAGIGYGGSCFPKDTHALIQIAGNVDYEFKLLKSVVEVNNDQRFNIIAKLNHSLGDLQGKTIGIWGLAFKPNTDDVREAPALDIIKTLLDEGATVKAYDPIATENFRHFFRDEAVVQWSEDALEAAESCDALCLLTDWAEFKQVDLAKLGSVMKQPILIDGRNVYSRDQLADTNFQYYSIGRPQLESLSPFRKSVASD
ncbi:UDP-glucose/GDP-mannose dehydrogenase family protein [Saccharibacillus sp. CPCC 101409]|uniref:UDP-glucose dehydrogenase family protein n=1 Tax=Saccharibacillus sp. CPCC 101409 TaxID=3058041 RepID=UPI002672BCE8|nr:UDP-glucose/GDP-mannose dehydrogenase family protein [Saccharibacillus sp. CPCC 101409]MDO3411674.1 UDP-glucose/GDP-mannose dehydrogenase family protein [Saccharibacillus sp. CPCC 101409]